MGRYLGPKERLSRALGTDLLLKGKRAEADKTAFQRGRPRPGQHGRSRKKVSEYGLRLKEKQKLTLGRARATSLYVFRYCHRCLRNTQRQDHRQTSVPLSLYVLLSKRSTHDRNNLEAALF